MYHGDHFGGDDAIPIIDGEYTITDLQVAHRNLPAIGGDRSISQREALRFALRERTSIIAARLRQHTYE